MLRTCIDCPATFISKSNRCPECRSLHKEREKKKWQDEQQRKRVIAAGGPWPCEICHQDNVWRRNGKYCDVCREKVSKYEKRTKKPVKANTLPPDSTTHEQKMLQRFRERQEREAAYEARHNSRSAGHAALHRSEALTGACGAVSYGSRQAGSTACE